MNKGSWLQNHDAQNAQARCIDSRLVDTWELSAAKDPMVIEERERKVFVWMRYRAACQVTGLDRMKEHLADLP